MKSVLAASLSVLPIACLASTVSVGTTQLDLPPPSGFALLTTEMQRTYELQRSFTPPANEQLAAFILESEVTLALNDQNPDLTRTCSVQTMKSLIGVTVSKSDFADVKRTLRTQNDEAVRQAEHDLPELLDSANRSISRAIGTDVTLSAPHVVALAAHQESERSMSYSMYLTYVVTSPSMPSQKFATSGTLTVVHVRGTILFLYVYAEQDGLEWTRDTAKQWAQAIVDANPSGVEHSVKESLPRWLTGLDWTKIAAAAILGGVGALIKMAVERSRRAKAI